MLFGSDASKEHTGPLSEKKLKHQDVYVTVERNDELQAGETDVETKLSRLL